jgi:uncharacterized repeat protein (TIGR01451 family)
MALNVVITDTFPAGTTPNPLSLPPTCGWTGLVIKCNLGNLASGKMVEVNFTVKTDSSLTPGTSLENVADVGSSTPDPNPLNNRSVADTSIISKADLSVVKTGPATVTAGELVTYTILVNNSGPATGKDVDVKDLLPAGVSYVSATTTQGTCVSAICQLGDLPVGKTVTITVIGKVGSDVQNGADLVNTATVFSDSEDTNPANNSSSVTSRVQTKADLQVVKVDFKDPVGPTESLLYQVTVTNIGPSDARDVVVTDTLDSNVTFGGASLGCTNTPAPNKVTCAVGTLPAGQSISYLISVVVKDVPGGTILNNNVSVASTTTDPVSSNNTDSEQTTVQPQLGPAADVSITKTATPGTVIAGQQVDYVITVSNAGPQTATNVRVVDLIPFGTSLVSLSVNNPGDVGEYCSTSGACYLGSLPVGGNASVSVTLKVNPDYKSSKLVNTATVLADQADANTSNNFASATVNVNQRADLQIAKIDLVDPVVAGENILYELRVTNNGPSDAQNVVVTDAIPANTTFVTASGGCVLSSGTVTCSLGSLSAGATASALLQVKVTQGVANGTLINNSATVSSATTDPDTSNNTEGEITTVNQSPFNPTDLAITKSDTPDPVIAGENITYQLQVVNNGPAPATLVQVVDSLPSGVSFISATSTRGLCISGVFCQLGSMSVGDTATITIVGKVSGSQKTALSNTAMVTSVNPDNITSNNNATALTEVIQNFDLSVTKTANPSPAVSGGSLAYEIVVSNVGPSDATNVKLLDVLPGELTSPNISTSQGSCGLTTPVLFRCNLGTVTVGKNVVITVVGTVIGNASSDLYNYVEVYGYDGTDRNDKNDSFTLITPLIQKADLGIAKTSSKDVISAGTSFSYTLTVANAGPSTAASVQVTDTLPEYITFISANPTAASGPNPLVWNLGAMNAGETRILTINVQAAANLPSGLVLINRAAVSSPTADPNTANNNATATTQAFGDADVEVSKRPATGTVIAGRDVTWTITVFNRGPSVSRNVDIKEQLPSGMTLNSLTTTQGVCVSGICQLGDMAVNSTVTITANTTVAANVLKGTQLCNTATKFGQTNDPDASDDSAVACITVDTLADLSLQKTASVSTAAPGGAYSYTITVQNNGPSDAQNVVVTDPLSTKVSFVSSTPSPANLNPLGWNLGAIPAGGTRTIIVNVTVNAGASGTIVNTAVVNSSTTDPNTNNNSDSETVTVAATADLKIQKIGPSSSVSKSTIITFDLVVTNLGPGAASNVVVTDNLPYDVSYVSSTPAPVSTTPLAWNLGTIQPGASQTIQLRVFVESWARKQFSNFASVTSTTPDPDSQNNNTEAVVTTRPPTAVQMLTFDVKQVSDLSVTLEWVMASQVDIFSYRLFRATVDDFTTAEKIAELPAVQDLVYTYVDQAPANGVYYYWLSHVNNAGSEGEPMGVAQALVGYTNKVFLPFVRR